MWNNFFMLQRDMLQYMFIIFRNIVNNIVIYIGNPISISITKAKISLLVNVKRYRKGKKFWLL